MSLSNPSSLNDFFGPGPRIDVTQRRVSRATDILRQFTEAQRDYKHRLRCRLQFIKWISLSELYRLKRRLKTHKHIYKLPCRPEQMCWLPIAFKLYVRRTAICLFSASFLIEFVIQEEVHNTSIKHTKYGILSLQPFPRARRSPLCK